jgi:hypothetical protein
MLNTNEKEKTLQRYPRRIQNFTRQKGMGGREAADRSLV